MEPCLAANTGTCVAGVATYAVEDVESILAKDPLTWRIQ